MKTMEENEIPTLVVIQQIKDGRVNPKSLDKETRLQCVELLSVQGYTNAQIAQILNRSDKTVQRDLAEIRKQNSLTPHPDLAKEMVGEMLSKARNSETHLSQLAHAKEGSISERAQAQFLCWRVVKECVDKLQTLGYLPLKPQEVTGNIHHSFTEEGDKSFAEIDEIIKDIDVNLQNSADPAIAEEVERLKAKYEKAKIVFEAKGILEKQKQLNQTEEER